MLRYNKEEIKGLKRILKEIEEEIKNGKVKKVVCAGWYYTVETQNYRLEFETGGFGSAKLIISKEDGEIYKEYHETAIELWKIISKKLNFRELAKNLIKKELEG